MKNFLVSLLLLVSFASEPVWGALAHVQTQKGTTTAGTVANTTAMTTTSGNLVVVTAGAFSTVSSPTSTITDAATGCSSPCNTWAEVASCAVGGAVVDPSGVTRYRQFYAKNITGGANHIFTQTIGSASNFMTIFATEISGADTTAPFDTCATAQATSTTPNTGATNTRAQADSIMVVSLGTGDTINAGSITAGSGFTIPTNGTETNFNNYYSAVEYQIFTSTGTTAGDFTITSQSWGVTGAVYKAASTATPSSAQRRRSQ